MSRFAGLLAALGVVALSFGLLSFGMAFFQPLMPMAWVWGNLGLGLALLAAAVIGGIDSLRERLRSSAGRRASVYAVNSLLTAALGLGILGLLAFLSTRHVRQFDWTEQRVNTLSEQSLELLDRLEGEVVLTAFFRPEDSTVVRDLLERYDAASDELTLRFVDPNRRPDLLEANRVDPEDLARGVLLLTRGDESVTLTQFSESEITNALLKLTPQSHRKIYFVYGHGEREMAAEGQPGEEAAAAGEAPALGRGGFTRAVAALRNEAYSVEPLLLAAQDEVPSDADAIVIAGPTRPFFDAERLLLERYLRAGGALLLMIDPRAQTNLYDDLTRWGVLVGDDVIVDAGRSLAGQPTAPLAAAYTEHPITESLGPTVFPMSRSVSVAHPQVAAGSDPGLVPLVLTGEGAWAERDLEAWMETGRAMQDDADLEGPVPLAVVGRPRVGPADATGGAATDAKLVVFGDSNFATNEFLDLLSNRDLFLNTLIWLIGDVERIAVRPNLARSSSATFTASQLQVIRYASLFALPEGIALLGAIVWWTRRRA